MIPDMTRRSSEPEKMDRSDCDTGLLLRTIDQFQLTNRLFSRYRTLLRRWVLSDMLSRPTQEFHLVDLGAGGLDIPLWLLREAHRRGIQLRITAVDNDPRIIEHVRPKAGANLHLVCGDALAFLEKASGVDYIFCNHFLHHLPELEIPDFIRRLARATRRRFIVSDLSRNRWSYLGYALFAGLFLRHSFAREDGLLSIRRGFRAEDLEAFVKTPEGSTTMDLLRLAPGRIVLIGTSGSSRFPPTGSGNL